MDPTMHAVNTTMTGRARAPSGNLIVSNLCAGYRGKQILHGISLSVSPGELLGIIGPNGAGKSTLLKAVLGLAEVTLGSVRLGDVDITRWPVHRRVRCGISYLMQGAAVFSSLSVEENVRLAGCLLAREERPKALASVFETWPALAANRSVAAGLLSGGQRQALSVAMAVVRRPRVLLLDEPSAGLAPAAARDTLARLAALNKETGTAVVIVEQRAREVLEIASRALILNNGVVYNETCRPTEWLDGGRIGQLVFGRVLGGSGGSK